MFNRIANKITVKIVKNLVPIAMIGSVGIVGYASFKYVEQKNIDSLYKNKNVPYDVCIVGGGIIGLSTATKLQVEYPEKKVVLIEKSTVGSGQTGHNSGVIHAGIYYKPGSLKAQMCTKGNRMMYDYCDEKNIPYKKIGKLIVATNDSEVETLKDLYDRALKNKVKNVRLLTTEDEIKKIQPGCKGKMAIYSPETGIIDFRKVCIQQKHDFLKNGGTIFENSMVKDITSIHSSNLKKNYDGGIKVIYSDNSTGSHNVKSINTKSLITCGGLYSDELAKMTRSDSSSDDLNNYQIQILPVRGEYLIMKKSSKINIQTNIYPVPNIKYPFLGVHYTPTMDGKVILGPNAILSTAKEGYKYSDVNLYDVFNYLTFSGFYKLALKHWQFGAGEFIKSILIHKQINELKKFIPEITIDDIDMNASYSGVRAQAIDKDGNLVEDFVFDTNEKNKIMHVVNAPSPGATSSLAIAEMIVDNYKKMI